LWIIAEQGIKAVEDGDFAQQVVLGQHVENAFEDVLDIAASGTYFRAEGLRLSAPLQAEDQRRRDFLEEAESAYVHAASSLPNDARPLRGLGRVLEVQGNLGKAEQILHRAKALAVLAHVAESATALGAAHERLRTTRHYVHCVLDMRSESPASVWNTEQKEEQLRGYVVECANLHAELMPLYQRRPLWAQIEWFMGLVFLAKAWASLGDVPNATFALLHALRFRVDLLPAEGMLSAVEHANLVWWLSVASHLQDGGDVIIRTAAHRMSTAVDSHDRRTVKLTAASVLYPILPPPLGAAATLGQAQPIGTAATEHQG
jgi:tetratricopeptide (TPR) repeat protein